MQEVDRKAYQWGHPDAVAVAPWYNLTIYLCRHCGITFLAPPR